MKVSGPLVVAENMSGTKMYEAHRLQDFFACSAAQESPSVAPFVVSGQSGLESTPRSKKSITSRL